MRVLVTGANGYIGQSACQALLAAGHDVAGVSRQPVRANGQAHAWYSGNLLDHEFSARLVAEVKPDAVLHLAWEVTHGKFWTAPSNLDWVAGTFALARYAADHGVQRFVATGTCFEYDWPEAGDCVENATPICNHLLYDSAKDAAHRGLSSYFQQLGVSFAWARIFNLYGGGEPAARLVPDVINSVITGKAAECGSGIQERDYMDVRDAGAGLAALTVSSVAGPINIASGDGQSIGAIANLIGELAGRPDLIRLGARADRPNEPARIVASTQRMRKELGFTPSITLSHGLADAITFWKHRQTSA